ncbi:MAG TPA: DUF2851 family protein [Bacteroidales bacterium]|nr:DUF2851 family protein [Bacteroidales bacterium]
MKEEFLHYLWKNCLFDSSCLKDNEGNTITVMHPGQYNHDSGPDFFDARIVIGDTLWAGNVEIHNQASQFILHGHHKDPAYDNVILHVVAANDKSVFNSRGVEILTIELKFSEALYESYLDLVNNPCIIACQDHLSEVDHFMVRQWLSVVSIERMERKTFHVGKLIEETGNDWEEVLYRMICRYFGFRINSEPFERLSRVLPSRIIHKHSDPFQVEALLFGAAGMLEEGLFPGALKDQYYKDLIKEFKILSSKYGIVPLHGWIWKFSRLRPVNFPTVRISQLASMLSASGGLFSRILECDCVDRLKKLLEVPASSYWRDHYLFGKQSRITSRNTGDQATGLLIINAIIPVMFVFGKLRGRQELCERAVELLEKLEPESNKIIMEWNNAGIQPGSAFMSQALIELRNEYCSKRKCIECRIGNYLISKGKLMKTDKEILLEPVENRPPRIF